MTVYQLPAEMGAFARYLGGMAEHLVAGEGWYGVFAGRDPDGLRACFGGTEIPPWDVVESLLQDLGESPLGAEAARARALHAAAAAAHDRRPGGAEALEERLAAMERERRYAEARADELAARLRAAPHAPDGDRIADALAWAGDDHARATARVAELTARRAALGPDGGRAPAPEPAPASGAAPAPAVRRKPRGARYAWFDDVEEAQLPAPEPRPEAVALPMAGGAPRGARFGGADAAQGGGRAGTAGTEQAATEAAATEADAVRAAGNAVYALRRLRAQGRSGEAHVLLCEAVAGPPGWLPALAAELHRVGLGADWSTLLWEAASLPPGRLAAVAGALADAGRVEDCEQLLRQGVARPVGELAGACAALRAEGHQREADALLAAFVRARTPEDAARLAAADPHALIPLLRTAARTVSPARERDLVHALRVAGMAGG
ncbi:UL36 very large tegument protein [Streptomyces sp. NPDC014870]|uniref:UL36 very large tegument protein n=1 Tax=Streptomyces sp. NPDC014870 TaxID=3364925 RepID=UPI0036FA9951